MRVEDTLRYHSHFLNNDCSLTDAIHFLAGFKPKFSKPSFADGEGDFASILGMVYR